MLYKPTLLLTRLVVTKGGVRVYDQPFHQGLNIIRGENGSGKTTIAEFIFYALGGDTPQWRAEAAICEYVYAEVVINGHPLTLRRQIEEEKLRPMAIFWGNFETGEKAQTEWQLFPYVTSTNKESFSQVIFRAAAIPAVKGQLATKVTMHQILRLIYVDQKTGYDQLFRADPFDPQLTREAVGDLLCGVYDDRLYEAELELSDKNAEKASLASELRTIHTLLGDQTIPNLDWLDQEKSTHRREREETYAAITRLRIGKSADLVEALSERRAQVAAELERLNIAVRVLEDRGREERIQAVDRAQFLSALKARLEALKESEAVHQGLGAFSFHFCPSCYAPITGQNGACHLCKSGSETRKGQNLLRLRHELEQQIKESEMLQAQLTSDATKSAEELRPAQEQQRKLQLQYDELSTTPTTAIDAAAADLHRRIGYIDRTIEDLEQRSRLASRVSAISERLAVLAGDISKLNDEIARRKASQEKIKHDVAATISGFTVDILKKDLQREAAFEHAAVVNFDFSTNRIFVDGQNTFAASSNVYLKNAFHLALLQASTLKEYMRYPRLVIFDNVEDKGMEVARSHNFQRLVREYSDTTEVDHQIIMCTSMIAPELESEPSFLIGPFYTHEAKTLRIRAVAGTALDLE